MNEEYNVDSFYFVKMYYAITRLYLIGTGYFYV